MFGLIFPRYFWKKADILSYLKGFGVTLEVSFFAVLLGVAVGALLAIVKYMAVRHKKIPIAGLDRQCLYYCDPRNPRLCADADHLFHDLYG